MNDEQLIELIRKNPALYDLSHPRYMNNAFKIHLWKKIATCMKEDVAICKARWNNIRDNYRRSLKRVTTKSGRSVKKIKLYKYADQLGFLKEYFEQRETKGNIESQGKHQIITKEERDGSEERQEDGNKEENEYNGQNDVAEANVVLHVNDDSHDDSNYDTTETATKSAKRIATTENIEKQQQTTSSKLMEYLIDQKSQHPVDAFLAGVAPTLKSLPPYYVHLAKTEIFNTVQKYEMKMLTEQKYYQSISQHNSVTSN